MFSTEYSSLHVGPIPAPVILGQYDNILPGAAERLFVMAEKEQSHRHNIDEKGLDAQIRDIRRGRLENNIGQVFGLTIALAAIIAGSITAIKGKEIPGGFIGTAGVASLVYVFVKGKENQSTDTKD